MSDRRTFSYEEALQVLPDVRELTEKAVGAIEALTGSPATPADGEEELAIPEDLLPEVERILTDWAASLMALGVEVKGLWLVDFDNGEGYYCWRHPEPDVSHFHGYDEGFAGRMKIV